MCFVFGWVGQVAKSTKERISIPADDEDVPGSYLLIVVTEIFVIAVAAISLFVIIIRH